MSKNSTFACICDQKAPTSTPICATATKCPPNIPTIENKQASSGIEKTPAQKRGAITREIGLTAIISIAESCSVAFIKPISAVIAVPARPAKSKAVTTGPNSRNQCQRD